MIAMSQNQLRKLQMDMGFNEYHNNSTHMFFQDNGIRLGFNFRLKQWNLFFESDRQETLFRLQYANILTT